MPMNTVIQESIEEIKSFSQGQFSALFRISRLLNGASHKEKLIEKALDMVVEVIRADRGVFVRYDAEKNSFEIIAARNIKRQSISDLGNFSSGILQQVIDKKESCLYHDVMSDPNISQFESVQRQQIKSIIGVPVFYKNMIWGVILADSHTNRREFTDENLLFLQFFSNLVSLSLDKILHLERLEDENKVLRKQLENSQPIPEMIGNSAVMRAVSRLIHKVASSDATVLILGESGTGKDIAARAIHRLSPRCKEPYLAQFCGSIPDSLLESELFGYKRGAFSGANSDKKGLFEVATGGTFFLDEIADISMALQAKLLRVIENQEIIPLGDTRVKKVDVRLIAATNKDLRRLSKEGKFREDLFYRLNVIPVHVPALRDRPGDISLLAQHFLRQICQKTGKSLKQWGDGCMALFESYSWPGNVRELMNFTERMVILSHQNIISAEDVAEALPESRGRPVQQLKSSQPVLSFREQMDSFEKQILLQGFQEVGGNVSELSRRLKIDRANLHRKLKSYGIK